MYTSYLLVYYYHYTYSSAIVVIVIVVLPIGSEYTSALLPRYSITLRGTLVLCYRYSDSSITNR